MRRQGFTLIELSIVLVIIGLIVGGVLVGRELIRTAELRSDISTVQKMESAVQAFRLKYNCLPGDCVNPAQFLGTGAGPSGDGNGNITEACNGGCSARVYLTYLNYVNSEMAGFYNDLAWANMISVMPFDPTFASGTPMGNTLLPMKSAVNQYILFGCAIALTGRVDSCHYARLGVTIDDGDNEPKTDDPPYTTADAYYIDNKLDDGKALTGNVISPANVALYADGAFLPSSAAASGACASNGTGNPYNTTSTGAGKLCGLRIKMSF